MGEGEPVGMRGKERVRSRRGEGRGEAGLFSPPSLPPFSPSLVSAPPHHPLNETLTAGDRSLFAFN